MESKDNSIYIPKVGASNIKFNLSNDELKNKNYIQIVLKKNIANSEYLSIFFSSQLGVLFLHSLFSGVTIRYISTKDIENCIIPIPSLKIQQEIISTSNKLNLLKNELDEFSNEISLNPKNSSIIQQNLDNMLKSLDKLTDSDKVLSLIRNSENKEIEFKSTLRKSIEKKNVPHSVIEKNVIKTIAGFLNASGGYLLVGVKDDGTLLGLCNDDFKSNDGILKHVANLIKRDFGPECYDLIDYKIVPVKSKQVLLFDCKKSNKEIFLKKTGEFFVRRSPRTDQLEGKELIDYVKNHFGNIK
jgi:hypothetical protein